MKFGFLVIIALVAGLGLGGAYAAFAPSQGKTSPTATASARQPTSGGQVAAAAETPSPSGTPASGAPGTSTRGQSGGTQRTGAGSALAGTVAGKVQEVTGDTITVLTEGGATAKVVVAPNTSIQKTISTTLSEIKVGEQIMVRGDRKEDGSLSANVIQVGVTMGPP
ncbi:MAG: hypothetical protein HYU86_05990 [Chloroflexi bacterium]|nr:hypothetical protein [Chloroflexota bacterium]